MSFTPIVKFDNRICIPKIVPLVYDDVLSYYEYVDKILVKLNETIVTLNQLGVKVDDLEAAVQQLQTVIDGIDTRLSTAESNISTIQGNITTINNAIETINGAITTINTAVETNTADISTLNSTVAGMQSTISDILDDLAGLPADVAGLEGEVDNLDTRVTNLESATFGDVSVSPVPVNFGCYCIDPDMIDYEIIQDTTSPDPTWDWTVKMAENPLYPNGKNQICFRGNEYYNKSHLVIKNFMPHMQDSDPLTLLIKYNYKWDYTSNCQAVNTSFGALVNGINCVLGTYNTICVGGAQLVPSSDNSDIYDLVLSAQSLSGSGTWTDNSDYFLNYVAILGGVGYLSDGRIRLDEGEKYFNCFNAGIKQGVSQSDFDTLSNRVSDTEDDINFLEGSISSINTSITNINTSIGNINTKDSQQDSAISTANGNISALQAATTPEVWDRWQDVYDEGSITPNSRIIGFHMEKVGKLVTFEIAGCHFRNDSNHNSTTFCLGTIRSGLRSKLAPRGNVPVTFTGMTAYTDGNLTGLEQSGDSGSQYTPLVPNARGVAVLTIYGSDTSVPYTWSGRTNQAYSINVNICGMPYQTADASVTNNAFIIRGCYVTV